MVVTSYRRNSHSIIQQNSVLIDLGLEFSWKVRFVNVLQPSLKLLMKAVVKDLFQFSAVKLYQDVFHEWFPEIDGLSSL